MATAELAPRLHIEAIQSVTSAKPATPGGTRHVSAPAHLVGKLLRGRAHVVALYERKAEEPRHLLVGWLKESLNAALVEFPVLAGRVRRTGEGLEVKLTDSGVRLVQAEAEVSLKEFVRGGGSEEALAYWGEVDEANPRFSALCYVQVTTFQGEGYSISISCSLLLADPFLLATFFKHWSQIHNTMKSLNRLSAVPIFHYGTLRNPRLASHLTSIPLHRSPSPTSHAVLFHHPTAHNLQITDVLAVANACIDQTTGDPAAAPEFCVLVHRAEEEEVVVEPCKRVGKDAACNRDGAISIGWEAMGAEGTRFEEGVEVVGVRHGVVFDGRMAVVAVGGQLGLVCAVVAPGK